MKTTVEKNSLNFSISSTDSESNIEIAINAPQLKDLTVECKPGFSITDSAGKVFELSASEVAELSGSLMGYVFYHKMEFNNPFLGDEMMNSYEITKHFFASKHFKHYNVDAARFWELFEYMKSRGMISERDGHYKHDNGMLVLHLSSLMVPYRKLAMDLKHEKILDKAGLRKCLENQPYFVPMLDGNGWPKRTRFARSLPIEGIWFDPSVLFDTHEVDLFPPQENTGIV